MQQNFLSEAEMSFLLSLVSEHLLFDVYVSLFVALSHFFAQPSLSSSGFGGIM